MKSLLLLALFYFGHLGAVDAGCELPRGESLTIGCSYQCDLPTRVRVKAAALKHGLKVRFLNMAEQKDLSESLSQVDGVLIPGGADIHPKFYLKDVSDELREYTERNMHLVELTDEGRKRDLFEYTMVKIMLGSPELYQSMPLLGICRGMQMLSVARGIPLYLDIATELGIPNRYYKFDRISLQGEAGLMGELFQNNRTFYGFEMHHQGIRVDYFQAHQSSFPNVRVSAYSNQGKIAESIAYKDMTALGVQYHPEKSLPGAAAPVFDWLVERACDYKKSAKVSK